MTASGRAVLAIAVSAVMISVVVRAEPRKTTLYTKTQTTSVATERADTSLPGGPGLTLEGDADVGFSPSI